VFLLVALLIIVPVVELVVLVQVAHWIGVWEALFLLVAVSLLGAWMVKIQGLGVIRRISQDLSNRRVPAAGMVDGGLLLVAGTLLLVPGFVTDAIGLVLLVPFLRVAIRNGLIHRWTRKYLPVTIRSRPVQSRAPQPPTGPGSQWPPPPELGPGPTP
jgi:UPF0716 protein FxsA